VKKSANLFYFFLWAVSLAVSGVFFYSFSVLFLEDSGKSIFWMNCVVPFSALFSIIIFRLKKLPGAVKFLLGLIFTLLMVYLVKYLCSILGIISDSKIPKDSSILIFGFMIYFIMGIFILIINRNFNKINRLFEGEKDFNSKESYLAWINEKISGNEKYTEEKWFVTIIMNIGFVLLIICFVTIARDPAAKWLESLYFILFSFGGLGLYFILYQYNSILKWKMAGYKVPGEMPSRWNQIITFFYIPLIIIPLIIPWNFQIFNVKGITEKLTQVLTGVTIDISEQKDNYLTNEIATNNVSNTIIFIKKEQQRENLITTKLVVSIVFWIVAVSAGFYLIAGIIGGFFFIKYRYARKNRIVQFFINRYYKLRNLFDILVAFISIIFRFFLGLFGFGGFGNNNTKKASPVEKQLFALFNAGKEMSGEKKEEVLTIIRQFVKMIEIASKFITPYYMHFGPVEYTQKISENLPSIKATLKAIVEVFNESRYSLHILSNDKKKDYTSNIDLVIEEITKKNS